MLLVSSEQELLAELTARGRHSANRTSRLGSPSSTALR